MGEDSLKGCRRVKPDKLYQELKDIAEKIGVRVSEQNFRTTGIRVKSGFCVVKDQNCCIIDKHLKLAKKLEVLAECIGENAHETLEGIYIVPAVREYLETFRPLSKDHVDQIAEVREAQVQSAVKKES
jgi:hypothetical protein